MLRKVVIIGTGPAALMAGTHLLESGYEVVFCEQKRAAARKFLVAGHGGFNLSNAIDKVRFIEKYDDSPIRDAVNAYDAAQLLGFLNKIGIETYVGSSGKIFPLPHIKPIEVLQAWLDYLFNLGARFEYQTEWLGLAGKQEVVLRKGELESRVNFDYLVLALGGASWSKTGSTGVWTSILNSWGVETKPFQSSNAGFNINWPIEMQAFEGQVFKNVECSLGTSTIRGEITISQYGLEGAPIYYLNPQQRQGARQLYVDMKPIYDEAKILAVLQAHSTVGAGLKSLKIPKAIITYLKLTLSKEAFLDSAFLAVYLKKVPFEVDSLRPIEEAISTVGGLGFEALHSNGSLKQFPNIFCCGEMLDWDAPTGGYLLQACFASGYHVAQGIIAQKRIGE